MMCALKGILFLLKKVAFTFNLCFFLIFIYMNIKIKVVKSNKNKGREEQTRKNICEKIKTHVSRGNLVLSNVLLPELSSNDNHKTKIYVPQKESGNVYLSLRFKRGLELPNLGILNNQGNIIQVFGMPMRISSAKELIEKC